MKHKHLRHFAEPAIPKSPFAHARALSRAHGAHAYARERYRRCHRYNKPLQHKGLDSAIPAWYLPFRYRSANRAPGSRCSACGRVISRTGLANSSARNRRDPARSDEALLHAWRFDRPVPAAAVLQLALDLHAYPQLLGPHRTKRGNQTALGRILTRLANEGALTAPNTP